MKDSAALKRFERKENLPCILMTFTTLTFEFKLLYLFNTNSKNNMILFSKYLKEEKTKFLLTRENKNAAQDFVS